MSDYKSSKAQVVKIKGVSFNYVQFLWNGIATVKQAQSKKMYSEAMRLTIELVDYLPDTIKNDFRGRATQIAATMEMITSNALKCLKAVPDFYIRGIYRNRILQTYCSKAFSKFINDLSDKLNALGYMENVDRIEEGEDDWYRLHRQEQMKKKAAQQRAIKKDQHGKEAEKFSKVEGID